MKKYKLAVFIGRFSPFHNGHKFIIDTALKEAERVLVLIGSPYTRRTLRNPFTYEERRSMIQSTYKENTPYIDPRVLVEPCEDFTYNDDMWIENVQYLANQYEPDDSKIALAGHYKDASSYYVKLFPRWSNIDIPNHNVINATDIRTALFESESITTNIIPQATFNFLNSFRRTDIYSKLIDRTIFVQKYHNDWGKGPFVTTDACVVQTANILLIERSDEPGTWALPGGFLENSETIINGTIRELMEETSIDLSERTLRRCITKTNVYDNPNRSERARIITHASLIELDPDKKLVKVKAGDDAKSVKWWKFSDITSDMMYDDHFHIIRHLTGKL